MMQMFMIGNVLTLSVKSHTRKINSKLRKKTVVRRRCRNRNKKEYMDLDRRLKVPTQTNYQISTLATRIGACLRTKAMEVVMIPPKYTDNLFKI